MDSLVEKSISMSKQIKPFMLSAFFSLYTTDKWTGASDAANSRVKPDFKHEKKTNKLSHEKNMHWTCGKNVHKHIRVDAGTENQ